jgi:hypothetical protein
MRHFLQATIAVIAITSVAAAQSVCLPAPRLLTTIPMGGKAGTQVEITITGEFLEDAGELTFSDPRLTATRKLDANGQPVANQHVVTIAPDCPVGVYEARIMTRLGQSSSRIFSVGSLQELIQGQPNTSLATALELPVNSVCNAATTNRAVDHFAFEAKQGQRVIVDCATRGIDSKLDAVVIIADAMGRDLLVERRGGVLDFTVPDDGKYVIKVHELTFKGGPEFFYRLGLWAQPPGTPIVRQPGTKPVHSFSWPPEGLRETAELTEAEPNNSGSAAQKITLPCDISGSFFPAADMDVFEFDSKKGEEWWVEVASERFGLPTDPAVLVQQVSGDKAIDVADFSDVPSPVKVSSNGYAYDGPPYNAGTSDVLGKLVIKEDGTHRLQITDLFGGTRNDARNVYRLVIRKAAPDFAVVAWALHMELRNGDRNALSKPIALRGGATLALEVIAFRRDGFDGDIDLFMEDLPPGVVAHGLRIPAGQSRGVMLVTAKADAPRGFANAKFYGRGSINGLAATRVCRMASMSWPIPDAWNEVPYPRLITDVPVSVSGFEQSPITIAPASPDAIEVAAGGKVTIQLAHARRSDFSGATMQLKAISPGFERVPAFDVSLAADKSEATLDLATLKTAPGDYLVAFHGSAVAKYRHRPDLVTAAEEGLRKADEAVKRLEAEARKLAEQLQAQPENAEALKPMSEAIAVQQKEAAAAQSNAQNQLKQATAAAQPRDIVDIVVTEPVAIRVKPPESK